MANEVSNAPDSSWTLDTLPFGHPATDRVPIVVSRKDDDLYVAGTAVLVIPGLLLTARHVLTHPLWKHQRKALAPGQDYDLRARFDLHALHPRVDNTYLNWTVLRTSAMGEADLAWLQAATGDVVSPDLGTPIRMTLKRPPVGSRIEAVGYPGAEVVYPADARPELAMQAVRVTGRVVDPYVDKDPDASTILFQTDAPFDDGMSGGPVYDESGALCGIVSRGWNWDTGDRISSASLLWPALAFKLAPMPFEAVTVYELAATGILDVFGWERCIFRGEQLLFAADADW
jgi:hypothetical protein